MRAAASLVVVVGLVAACSSSDDASGNLPVGAGTEAYAKASCANAQKCGPDNFHALYGDVNGCIDVVEQSVAFGLTLPGITTTDAQIQACANAIAGLDCGGAEPAACHFTGSLAIAASCESDTQCQSGYCKIVYTDGVAPGTCGTCQATVGAGGPCTSGTIDCNDGLACDPTAMTCATPLAKGATCTLLGLGCADGLYCVAGTCGDPIAEGAPCDASTGNPCAGTLACTNGTCQQSTPAVQLADIGGACGYQPGGAYIGCASSSCVGAPGQQKCTARAKLGEPCSDAQPTSGVGAETVPAPECGGILVCTNGICYRPDPNKCK